MADDNKPRHTFAFEIEVVGPPGGSIKASAKRGKKKASKKSKKKASKKSKKKASKKSKKGHK